MSIILRTLNDADDCRLWTRQVMNGLAAGRSGEVEKWRSEQRR